MQITQIYPFCYQCAKYYQSQWKFDIVMAKTILHSFFETRCIYLVSTAVHQRISSQTRTTNVDNADISDEQCMQINNI